MADKPPKYVTMAIPFKMIADAHVAVCTSWHMDRDLGKFEIGWMHACEPAVWSWAERMIKSKEEHEASVSAVEGARDGGRCGAPALSPAGDGA